jgi:hypothetical protein
MSCTNQDASAPPAKESTPRTTPKADLFTGDVQVLLASERSGTGNPTCRTILTETGYLPRSVDKQNVTNHLAAIIQDIYHKRKTSKEEITEYMFRQFADLCGGEGGDSREGKKAVRTQAELLCSMWAPRYPMDEKEGLLSMSE